MKWSTASDNCASVANSAYAREHKSVVRAAYAVIGLCAGLLQRAQLSAEGAFELEAPENRGESFAELLVVGDRIGDVRAANFLGFFAAEPRKYEVRPATSRAVAQRKKQL